MSSLALRIRTITPLLNLNLKQVNNSNHFTKTCRLPTKSRSAPLLLSSQRCLVTITKSSPSSVPVPSPPSPQAVTVTDNNTNTTHKIIQDHDSIIITADAVEQINNLAKLKRPDAPDQMYLRVYVDAGGCSGFQYKFEIENADDTDADGDTSIDPEEDVVILCQDPETKVKVTVVVDEGSLELLKGSTISYVKEMIRSCFAVVSNPQSESACGCGSSFAVKKFESNPALD